MKINMRTMILSILSISSLIWINSCGYILEHDKANISSFIDNKSNIIYKYKPPQIILDTHFYSSDIISEIKFKYCGYEIDTEEAIDVCENKTSTEIISKKLSSTIPLKIINDMNQYVNETADTIDNTLIGVDYMLYDMNFDGILDYIIDGYTSKDGLHLTEIHLYKIYITQSDGTFKDVIWDKEQFNHNNYILKTSTNGLNDLMVLCNSNTPTIEYDGKDSYSKISFNDDKHIFS